MSDHLLPIVQSVLRLRAQVSAWRDRGASVALVPTMGALHDGHISLIRLAKIQADRVVASVFVNPRQFGPGEDFEAYPRTELADAQRLTEAGCDLMYTPTPAEMYPDGFSTLVSVRGVSEGLCGAARPGHFDGVATVVAKLLLQAAPDVAIFGEKDYQQLAVIRRLARDLDLTTKIIGAPTARALDGLALSSRNAYLDAQQRARAPRMHQVLAESASALSAGDPVERVQRSAHQALQTCGFDQVDYLEVRLADTLQPPPNGPITRAVRVLAAVRLGRTRLIDNVAAEPPRT
jgi:pantoate--beta-alanine ligase